ncbi:RecT family recombinase [Peptostreptococcus faecalis]|uniref:RecT family recombinase n=1 Tax=Peptostreptococcus faecalis TaxID=2045015 RepID=UPI000C7E3D3E|nr:RecT family recombinase [Peptostreptococcus faecalis]
MTNQVQKTENKEVVAEKNITDKALNAINKYVSDGVLHLPQNYSISNAMKSAYLTLEQTTDKDGNSVLKTCSKESIYQALLDMGIQGLTPSKNQCYFVAYGKKLTLMRSYMGTMAIAKRQEDIRDIKAYCIYEGDEFETDYDYESGVLKVSKYKPNFGNVDTSKMKGAFAVIIGEEGVIHTELMTMPQIKAAWSMGASKGNSKAHNNFNDEMAKKTVISRACKLFINTSDDSDVLLGDSFASSDEERIEEVKKESIDITVKEEIENNANSEVIDIDDFVEVKEDEQEEITASDDIVVPF